MSKEATRNQINAILAREKATLARTPTDEQLLFRKAEVIAKEVVLMGKEVFLADRHNYNREAMRDLMKKMYLQKYLSLMTKEEMAFLLAEMHSQETVSAVEVI